MRGFCDVPEVYFGNIHSLQDRFEGFQPVTLDNLLAITYQFCFVLGEVVFHRTQCHFIGHLFLEHHRLSLERDAGDVGSLLDLLPGIGVVEAILG